jgi:hypothetical protein
MQILVWTGETQALQRGYLALFSQTTSPAASLPLTAKANHAQLPADRALPWIKSQPRPERLLQKT